MDADAAPVANGAANGAEAQAPATPEPPATPSSLPEVEAYAYLVTLMFLVDHKQYQLVRAGREHRVVRLRGQQQWLESQVPSATAWRSGTASCSRRCPSW